MTVSSSPPRRADPIKSPPKSPSAVTLPGGGGVLVTAAVLVVVEMTAAAGFHLPLLPFIACALIFLGAILWAASAPPARADYAGRLVMVTVLLKVFAVGVALTGGFASPYLGILFLPVFLGALYFGLMGGACTGIAVCAFLVALTLWAARSGTPVPIPTLLTQCGVLLLVAVGAGAFAEHLRFTATTASRRARQQTARANQVEWFTDTAVMMQSLGDMEHMLSAALLRLEELTPFDSAAIFLRDPEEPEMTLAQTMGIAADHAGLHRVPLIPQKWLRDPELLALYVPNSLPGDPTLGIFAEFDTAARSVVVVPLRNFDDLFGLLYVASHQDGAFTERDRDNLVQFARHVVYPVQRVRLQAMATTDALMGLYNNRAFRRRLRTEVDRAIRYRHSLSLIMLDIDHFKKINDTLGHPAGDAILTQIGGILRRVTRGIDMSARYGGEEMAILCPETLLEDGFSLAERVRSTVASTDFALPSGGTTRITISAGVAALNLHSGTDALLIQEADAALYSAKSGGRNRVHAVTLDGSSTLKKTSRRSP